MPSPIDSCLPNTPRQKACREPNRLRTAHVAARHPSPDRDVILARRRTIKLRNQFPVQAERRAPVPPPRLFALGVCAGEELAAASAAGRRPRSPVASCRPPLAAGLRCQRRDGADRPRLSVTTVFAGRRSRAWVNPWTLLCSRGPRGPPMCGSLLTSYLCGGHASPFFSPIDCFSIIHLPLPSLPVLKRRQQVCPRV